MEKSEFEQVGAARRDLPQAPKAQKPINSASSALLRVSEVADIIGSTEAQVRNMRARAQLPPPIKVPGLGVRWRRADLERWLARLGERS